MPGKANQPANQNHLDLAATHMMDEMMRLLSSSIYYFD
jgi:hypothetical protein